MIKKILLKIINQLILIIIKFILTLIILLIFSINSIIYLKNCFDRKTIKIIILSRKITDLSQNLDIRGEEYLCENFKNIKNLKNIKNFKNIKNKKKIRNLKKKLIKNNNYYKKIERINNIDTFQIYQRKVVKIENNKWEIQY